MGGVEVVSGVLVLGTHVAGAQVLVDVYGSERNLCGSIRFAPQDRTARRAMSTQLRCWADATTPLTMVRRGRTVTLQDDTHVYGGQLPVAP